MAKVWVLMGACFGEGCEGILCSDGRAGATSLRSWVVGCSLVAAAVLRDRTVCLDCYVTVDL